MNIRISGGQFKGFKFNNPKSSDLRPTMESVRLAIFSILDSKFDGITDETVFLDLYSGTGIMGIEALSRGASRIDFVEKDRHVFKILEKNTALFHNAKITLHRNDAFHYLSRISSEKFDVIFADPPYFLSNDGITCVNGKMVKVNKGDWDKSKGIEKFCLQSSEQILLKNPV